MQHSGPNSSCPCCGRTKGDYCRWDASRILCYVGQTCGPPADLTIGQTLEIDGQDWALVLQNCGFAGSSWMFVRDDPSTAPAKSRSPEALRRQAVALLLQHDQFEQDADLATTAVRRIEDLQEFIRLSPAEIREALELCSGATVLLTDLLVRCRRLRRTSPDIATTAAHLQDGLRAVRYQGQDLHRFWHQELCDPAGGRGQRLAIELQLHRQLPEVD
jgi:hypothetical protein